MPSTIITGTGAFIPGHIKPNEDFRNHAFYSDDGTAIAQKTDIIITKFKAITGILERRYISPGMNASDIAAEAGKNAITDSGIDPESLDQIVVSHNFGDISYGSVQSRMVPTLASRVKHLLGIVRPECIAYDVVVGCPGWIHSVIQSHAWFRAGMAGRVLLIGTEALSRVVDLADRDSMIFADGAGACVLEYRESETGSSGILGTSAQSHCLGELEYINMGPSYCRETSDDTYYIKMQGRKVYEYALNRVPAAMKDCLDKSGLDISQVSKILIHQANEKMDAEIVNRFYALYGISAPPPGIMPMSIQWLGNSSVATIPTLYHLIRKGQLPEHRIRSGDVLLFASVGAGMNINAFTYRV